MKEENKNAIKTGLWQGAIFAILMAGFVDSPDEPIRVSKFLFRFASFGLAIGLCFRYLNKKKQN
jgi:hypothetical protein